MLSGELRELGVKARKAERRAWQLLVLARKLAKKRDESRAVHCVRLASVITAGVGKWVERFVLYDSLIGFLGELGRFDEALRIAGSVKPSILKSYVVGMVSKAYLKQAELEKALRIARKVSRPSAKGSLLVDIADWCLANGKPVRAKKLLSDALAAAQSPRLRGDDRAEMCESIALMYGKLGMRRKALRAARMIQDSKKKEQVLKRIGQEL